VLSSLCIFFFKLVRWPKFDAMNQMADLYYKIFGVAEVRNMVSNFGHPLFKKKKVLVN
jgi:hypothetical protein